MIVTLGPWDFSGYILLELLHLIDMNHIVINIDDNNNNLFKDSKTIYNTNILKSFEEAILHYVS